MLKKIKQKICQYYYVSEMRVSNKKRKTFEKIGKDIVANIPQPTFQIRETQYSTRVPFGKTTITIPPPSHLVDTWTLDHSDKSLSRASHKIVTERQNQKEKKKERFFFFFLKNWISITSVRIIPPLSCSVHTPHQAPTRIRNRRIIQRTHNPMRLIPF